jgi:rod shape determining protein RodA
MAATLGAGAGVAGTRRRSLIGGVPWREIDVSLVGALASIGAIGLLMVYASTRTELRQQGIDPAFYLKRQAMFLGLGAVLMVITAVVDYRRWRDLAPFLYAAMIALLLLVVSPLGAKSKGHQAWFPLGSFQLQPSEMSKVALILCLAAFASWSGRAPAGDREATLGLRKLSALIALAGFPMALIMLQPDLGTDLVFAAILAAVLVAANAKGRHLLILFGVGIAGVVAVLQLSILQPYQVARLTAFLDPKGDTRNIGYNLNESKITIGSGGLLGKGLFQGTQTNLSYVPEQHTDFVFTAVGEQLGFAGSALILALFAFVVWRTWRAAMLARDQAGTLICVGVLALIVFQVFENVGMTVGIMPIAGIPLPFVSYGGSALMAYSVGMGLVLNVHMRRFH